MFDVEVYAVDRNQAVEDLWAALKPPDLGKASASRVLRGILERQRAEATKLYCLKWKGTKIPRGVRLPEQPPIGWTQNGLVTGRSGEHIGCYCRILEFAGPDRNLHMMVIWT